MKRTLLKSATFIRAAKKVVRRDQQVAEAIRDTLTQLSEDAFHPTLKTHKLKGNLAGSGPVAWNTTYELSSSLSSMKV